MTMGLLIFLVPIALFVKAFAIRSAELRRAARMVPVEARVTRRGNVPVRKEFPASPDSTERDGPHRGSRFLTVYEGSWTYSVGGRTYEGWLELPTPVFTQEQMPPATITVYYDPDHPPTSRLHAAPDRELVRAWMIFASVATVVAILIIVISSAGAQAE